MRVFTSVIIFLSIYCNGFTQNRLDSQEIDKSSRTPINTQPTFSPDKFQLTGYGAVNYYHFDYDTDLNLKDRFDPERLNLYLRYFFNDKINLQTELEFEHGGTGASISYDNQEEFGEFEQEIEKGGSIRLEQLNINFRISPFFNIRVGKVNLSFGLHQALDTSTRYFTTHRQEMENAILPLGWCETGIEIYGNITNRLNYRFYMVNGLDSSGFSSRGWIKNGFQDKFEYSIGESIAFAFRLNYKFGTHRDTFFGLSGYINDTAANRPKNDLETSAYVTIGEIHFSINENNWRVNAIGIYGNLEHSNLISLANINLSNNLGVKRTPVGKNAYGIAAELGYNILPLIAPKLLSQKLFPFGRIDIYDTMHKVEGNTLKNPRWERTTVTGGFNWVIHPQIVYKIHYSHRFLGSEHYDLVTLKPAGRKQSEKTFSMGIAFNF